MCLGVFVQWNEHSNKGKSNPIGYIIQENGCWEWTGGISREGYGKTNGHDRGRSTLAHRVIYTQIRGAVPRGLTLDHLCRNRKCVNPDHLEAVTHRENVLRGISPFANHARKTHCPQGHPLSGNNLKITNRGTARACRQCRRDRNRRSL